MFAGASTINIMSDLLEAINKNFYNYVTHYIRENGFPVDLEMFAIIEEKGICVITKWDYKLKKPTSEDLLNYNLRDVITSAEADRLRIAKDEFKNSPNYVFIKEMVVEIILDYNASRTPGPTMQ
jgi:hypothetical protein